MFCFCCESVIKGLKSCEGGSPTDGFNCCLDFFYLLLVSPNAVMTSLNLVYLCLLSKSSWILEYVHLLCLGSVKSRILVRMSSCSQQHLEKKHSMLMKRPWATILHFAVSLYVCCTVCSVIHCELFSCAQI